MTGLRRFVGNVLCADMEASGAFPQRSFSPQLLLIITTKLTFRLASFGCHEERSARRQTKQSHACERKNCLQIIRGHQP
uniref:Uncharacterized protein n=1 Tax=Ascaris lumbricoides TaxID=6252 RepID=A0A0M3HMK7_ASCLU